ncbi:PREDICTED: uncharacterized protein LOC107353190 isoform X2 [Acropora digitifera]|uniref:uncharacterized protein LOC107353190 isoform X2 n=1 Tax=Acropora digitifera TaxID=70779 RepID=UPI00077AAD41|nr:PREDICTED: uncharacterized protein LOC107353190 isoform X2 [Acropora digitifera]
MDHFYRSEIHGNLLAFLFGLLCRSLLFPPLTVGGDIIWLEPPPFETVTDASSIYRTTKQSIQGSLNEELSCNFSLTADSSIISVSMKFRGQPAVTFVPNVLLQVEPVFAKHFNAVWVPNKLSLNFFNVTYAEEGEYSCEVLTSGRSARSWIRKIQLLVLDPSQAMVSSTTVPENRIQTTVSAVTASEGDVPWVTIAAVVGAADAIAIVIAIAIVWCLKRRKRFQKEGSEERVLLQGQSGYAQSWPPAASGPDSAVMKREHETRIMVNFCAAESSKPVSCGYSGVSFIPKAEGHLMQVP